MSEETLGEGIIPNILYDHNGNDIHTTQTIMVANNNPISAAQPSIASPMTAGIITPLNQANYCDEFETGGLIDPNVPLNHASLLGLKVNSEFSQKWSREFQAIKPKAVKWVWHVFGEAQGLSVQINDEVSWFRRWLTSWLFGSTWKKP